MKAWILSIFFIVGCSGGQEPAGSLGGNTTTPPSTPSSCENTGCACATIGATLTCRAVRVSGSYTTCSVGTRTCEAPGVWSECVGDRIFDEVMPDAGGDAGSDVEVVPGREPSDADVETGEPKDGGDTG